MDNKKSLSELKKDLADKLLDKGEMNALKGGKDVGSSFEKEQEQTNEQDRWSGFGGILPQ